MKSKSSEGNGIKEIDLKTFREWWDDCVLQKVSEINPYETTIASPYLWMIYKTALNSVFNMYDEKYKNSMSYQKDKGYIKNTIAETVAMTMFVFKEQINELIINHKL